MTTESPIRYAFRTVWRTPDLALAEIAWRWAWGAASLVIGWFAAREFLSSLLVSNRDYFQLRSNNPQWVADAIVHIFAGSGPTMLRLFLIITPAALVLWIIAASLGRAATLRALLGNHRPLVGRTVGLHVSRVVIGLMAFVGMVSSFLLGSVLAARTDPPQPLIFIVVFFPLSIVFTILRSRINWFLLLANVYAAEGSTSAAGFGEATRIFKRRSGDFMGVGTVVGVIRIALMVVVTLLSLALVGAVGQAPGKLLWAAFLILTLAYFAVSDWLYVVKLAAYARIIADDRDTGRQAAAVAPAAVAEPEKVRI
jgi:hypothetical protein